MLKKLTDNAETILKERYYLRDKIGRVIEDWPALCHRVVDCVVPEDRLVETYKYTKKEAKKIREQMFQMINELYFLPNSPTLFGAGTHLPMLSACFIVDMEDSLESIYRTIADAAKIEQYGGGIGCDFSSLRGKGSKISTTNGKSSGSVSFLKAFSDAISVIEQGGRRRGACLGILRVDHPDIEEFIAVKEEEGTLTNFNLSVGITDDFMEAVKKDLEWDLIDPNTKKVVKTLKAAELMSKIIKGAWLNGEPGVCFLDTVNKFNPTPHLGEIKSPNPCQPGWATVYTQWGIKTIGEIQEGEIVWTGKWWAPVIRKEMTGIKPVYAFRTLDGTFYGTENHKVVERGKKIEVARAVGIDTCLKPFQPPHEQKTSEIVSRQLISVEKVYSITVDATEHTYWTDGLLVSNCGEFYNIPYNSCNLASLNLTKFVENKKFNFTKFKKYIKLATLFLDCVIEACKYPLDKIDKTTKKTRPVGEGVMGWADMLLLLNMKYNSKKAFSLAERISEFMSLTSLSESVELAKRAGSYPEFCPENHKYEHYMEISGKKKTWKKLIKDISRFGLRNSHTLVMAPTGTIARIAGVSFGIEPNFSFEFDSNILDKAITYKHPIHQEFLSGKLDLDGDVFISTKDLSVDDHLKAQQSWQKYTHNGLSKTVNMPNSATEEDVLRAYVKAHEMGLKGITVYREGSRKKEVIVDKGQKQSKRGRKRIDINKDILKKLVEQERMSVQKLSEIYDCSTQTIRARLKEYDIEIINKPEIIERPDELDSKTYRIETSLGKLFLSVGIDERTGMPIETIMNIGKSASDITAMTEALGKMVSTSLQHNVPVEEVVKTLDEIGGADVVWYHGKQIKSIPDALAKILTKYVKGAAGQEVIKNNNNNGFEVKCPQCSSSLILQEGCFMCSNSKCNYTKCG